MLVALIAYMVLADPFNLFAPTVQAFASQDLVVVDDTRTPDPKVLGHLSRGDTVKGHWTDRRPGRARWLAVDWPGAAHAFIWGHAVSLKPRPDLVARTPGPVVASVGAQVFAEPDEASGAIDNLMPGENAAVIGTTASGWTEISLPVGGVGYVKSSVFGGAVDASAGLSGVAHDVCTLSPTDSVNAPAGTPNLAFVFDGNRQCVDHRYPYVPDETGGVKRVIFNDKEHRATLLYFTSDRQSFQRTDIQLDADAYKNLSKHEAELANLECPAPGDPAGAASVAKTLGKLTPAFGPQTPSMSMSRRVWRCTAG